MYLLLIIILIYLFLIAPSLKRKDLSSLMGWDYAHRGLFDNLRGIPENSLIAFQRAKTLGYGIEMDVQASKDNILVVFHDDDLKRMCSMDGEVKDYTYDQLKKFKLLDSNEKIPTLKQVLKIIGGSVPLIIEIKSSGEQTYQLAQQVHEELTGYEGAYCIESFDPRALNWYKKHAPNVIRGQLAMSSKSELNPVTYFSLKYFLINVLSRPDFIAYQYKQGHNISVWLLKNFFQITLVAWTVKSKSDYLNLKGDYHLQIFEGFFPKN